jgi:hypothetical protein
MALIYFLKLLYYKPMNLKSLITLVTIVFCSINCYCQKEITETFEKRFNAYTSWTKGQQPTEYKYLKNRMKYEFTETSINIYLEKTGTFNTYSKWELYSTYTIAKSQKVRAETGSIYYIYILSNGMQFGYNTNTSKLIIQNGTEMTEYIDQ